MAFIRPISGNASFAVMIDMSDCEEIAAIYGNSDEAIAFGLITSAPNEDILIKFIDYLMK